MASRTAPAVIHPGSLIGTSKTVTGFWLPHCFGSKELMKDVISERFELVKSGKLNPVTGLTFGLSQATRAHKAMLARETNK